MSRDFSRYLKASFHLKTIEILWNGEDNIVSILNVGNDVIQVVLCLLHLRPTNVDHPDPNSIFERSLTFQLFGHSLKTERD